MRLRLSRRAVAGALLVALAATVLAGPAWAQADTEKLRSAKSLFFDRKYSEARQAWQSLRASAKGADADAAAFWIARCSENLGEHERALSEYGEYLDRRPSDAVLAEEARTSRVGLAAKLYKSGQKQHIALLQQGLLDPSKTVRYYTALQLSSLGCHVGAEALPVLRRILGEEKDPDLLERAKLALLRCDPKALAELKARSRPAGSGREVSWIKVRIYDKGKSKPQVSVNMPVALAELLFKSLPDEARAELKRKGYDPENFWEKLKKLPPTQILEVDGEDGGRVQIWLE